MMTADEFEIYNERAAIMEFDGGLPRKIAEIRAADYILRLRAGLADANDDEAPF